MNLFRFSSSLPLTSSPLLKSIPSKVWSTPSIRLWGPSIRGENFQGSIPSIYLLGRSFSSRNGINGKLLFYNVHPIHPNPHVSIQIRWNSTKKQEIGTIPEDQNKIDQIKEENPTIEETEQEKETPKTITERIFSAETFFALLGLSVIGGVVAFFWNASQQNKKEQEIKDKIKSSYPISATEILTFRDCNTWLTVPFLIELKKHMEKKFFSSSSPTFEEQKSLELNLTTIEKEMFELTQNTFFCRSFIARLARELYPAEVTTADDLDTVKLDWATWQFILTMLSHSSHRERVMFCFSLVDEDGDGKISTKEYQEIVEKSTNIGWCYSSRRYKQVGKYPPSFDVRSCTELTEDLLAHVDGLDGVSFEMVLETPLRLV